MLFSVSTIAIIGVIYMMTFLGLAWLADRKYIPKSISAHPIVYVLSLGAGTGSWTLFGSVGLAHELGVSFLAYYIGLFSIFALAPILIKPLLIISRTWQLKSLADLFTFRFHSSLVGSITTFMNFLAILPLLALQIRAVSNIIEVISNSNSCDCIAPAFATLVVVFTLLFGVRHISSKSSQSGFMFAIAMQSLLKLVCMLVISGVILFNVFDSPLSLTKWLINNGNTLNTLNKSLDEGPWRMLMPIFLTTTLTMPHVFFLIFAHRHKQQSMKMAAWGMPLLFLLTSITTPLIFWASMKHGTGLYIAPEYAVLQLSSNLNSSLLILMVYLAAIAAATGLLSITVLTLSSMMVNHLVLPFSKQPKRVNLYSWLQWVKRMLIPGIVMLAYGLYSSLPKDTDLTHLALVSFSAMMQFLPGLIATPYFKKANRCGFLAGIAGGMLIWLIYVFLPTFNSDSYSELESLHIPSYGSSWHWISIVSLLTNIALFYFVSVLTKTPDKERQRATLCFYENHALNRYRTNSQASLPELEKRLGSFIGSSAAQREVSKALYELNYSHHEKRGFAIERFRNQLESNICGLLGPGVAQGIIASCFPNQSSDIVQDFHYLESKLGAYQFKLTGLAAELDKLRRFHRNTLQSLPISVCLLSNENEILLWNRSMEFITGIRANDITGSTVCMLGPPWQAFINGFQQNESNRQIKRRLIVNEKIRWFNLQKAQVIIPESTFQTEYKERMFSSLEPGQDSLIILIEEVTETKRLEEQLIHNERLASVGQMAAGVAHEIGNPVTGIDCLAQELKNFSIEADTKEIAGQILQQTERISRILQSLVNFSHGGENVYSQEVKNAVNIRKCSAEAIALLSLSPENRNITFLNNCGEKDFIRGDEQKVTQIILNLLSNAIDASGPENITSNIITLDTCNLKNATIDFSVTDQGPGISEMVRDRIFEPFVTTKEVGKGTGLGLALVYSLVKEHGGTIKIESPVYPLKQAAGKGGCRFVINLPAYISEDESTRIEMQQQKSGRMFIADHKAPVLNNLNSQ